MKSSISNKLLNGGLNAINGHNENQEFTTKVNLDGIDKKYYIVEMTKVSQVQKEKNNKEVRESIIAQIKIENKISENSKLAKDISIKKFTRSEMDVFAKKNDLVVESTILTKIKDNNTFSSGIIKRIFATKDDDVDLITNSNLTKNFLILTIKTKYNDINKDSKEFEKYEAKARLNLINKIYKTYDDNLNQKYEVQLNTKTIDRVKNSF